MLKIKPPISILSCAILAGCAGGLVVNKPDSDTTKYARILNHALDEKSKANDPAHDQYSADINLIWPLWSSDSSTDKRYYYEHADITVTEGWFHIVYACPDVIFVDSYGKETIIHVKAGHTYKLICGANSEYGTLVDQTSEN